MSSHKDGQHLHTCIQQVDPQACLCQTVSRLLKFILRLIRKNGEVLPQRQCYKSISENGHYPFTRRLERQGFLKYTQWGRIVILFEKNQRQDHLTPRLCTAFPAFAVVNANMDDDCNNPCFGQFIVLGCQKLSPIVSTLQRWL